MPKPRALRESDPPPELRRPTTAEIFQENAPFAWRVLRRLGVCEADVDDVCQEVFVIVHRRLAQFQGRSTVRTWVYGICVRTASDYRKRTRTRREVAEDASVEPSIGPPQEDEISLRQARDTLDRVLDRLDDDRRTVFVLFEIEELPMTEVASIVGCPLQTAYSRLHSARHDIEAALQRARLGEARRSW